MGKFLRILAVLAVLAVSPAAYAQSPTVDAKKGNQFAYIDIYKPGKGDVELATALLKNEIDNFAKAGGSAPVVYARSVQFKGGDGKAMLFAQLDGPSACAWRGCAVYVLVKPSEQAKWAFGLTTQASDVWIDTRRQTTAFPRVVTQAPKERPGYWLWDGKQYRGAIK